MLKDISEEVLPVKICLMKHTLSNTNSNHVYLFRADIYAYCCFLRFLG